MNIWSQLLAWDQALFWAINRDWIAAWLDFLMPLVSDPNLFMPFLVAGGIALLIWGGSRGRRFLLLMALALVIGDAGINWIIKRSVNRPRPYQAMEEVRVVKRDQITLSGKPQPVDRGRSFTSGHACNNVALAFMACAVYGRAAWWLWLWAALVSYSRIYNGVHYPTDIVGSWIVATLYSWGIVYALSFWPKANKRESPPPSAVAEAEKQ